MLFGGKEDELGKAEKEILKFLELSADKSDDVRTLIKEGEYKEAFDLLEEARGDIDKAYEDLEHFVAIISKSEGDDE